MGKHTEASMEAWLVDLGFEQNVVHRGEAYWWLPKFTGQGDYMGGAVERSNRELLLEKFPEFLGEEGSGGYSYSACSLLDPQGWRTAYHWPNHPLHDKAVDLYETIESLHDYPCVDDGHLSELKESLVSEALPDKIKEIWRDELGNLDEDLVPFPEDVREKMERLLRDESGRFPPCIETGCIVAFDSRSESLAVEAAREWVVKWERGTREALAEEYEIPAFDVQSCEEVLDEIRSILDGVKFTFERVAAVRRIAAILNHPAVHE